MTRILDLTSHLAGPFATMLLAETGADVIKIERPDGGDPLRAAEGVRFDFLNRRKRSITLNLKSRAGRALFLRLLEQADAVVENYRPGTMSSFGLSYRTLRRAAPKIVLTSISNFGQNGPRRDWEGSELVLQAMGGVMDSTGQEGGPPMRLGGAPANYIAGVNAATATVAALLGVQSDDDAKGAHLDISIQETFSPHWVRHIMQYVYSGVRTTRGDGPQLRLSYPAMAMASDGLIYLLALRAEWESFAFFFGLEQFVTHEWSDDAVRKERWAEIDPHFHAAIKQRTRGEWVAAGVEMGYTFAPIDSPAGVVASPQLAARSFFQPAFMSSESGATGESVEVPCAKLPFSFAGGALRPNRAPALGEHTDEVFAELLGTGASELSRLRAKGVI